MSIIKRLFWTIILLPALPLILISRLDKDTDCRERGDWMINKMKGRR